MSDDFLEDTAIYFIIISVSYIRLNIFLFLQCFTSSDLVREYLRFGESHESGRQWHHSHHNSSGLADIERLAQMIVRRVISGLYWIVNYLTLKSQPLNHYSKKESQTGLYRTSNSALDCCLTFCDTHIADRVLMSDRSVGSHAIPCHHFQGLRVS